MDAVPAGEAAQPARAAPEQQSRTPAGAASGELAEYEYRRRERERRDRDERARVPSPPALPLPPPGGGYTLDGEDYPAAFRALHSLPSQWSPPRPKGPAVPGPTVAAPELALITREPSEASSTDPSTTTASSVTILSDGSRLESRPDGTPMRRWDPDGSVVTYDRRGVAVKRTGPRRRATTSLPPLPPHPEPVAEAPEPPAEEASGARSRATRDDDRILPPSMPPLPPMTAAPLATPAELGGVSVVYQTFDEQGRPLTGTLSDGRTVWYEYHANGEVTVHEGPPHAAGLGAGTPGTATLDTIPAGTTGTTPGILAPGATVPGVLAPSSAALPRIGTSNVVTTTGAPTTPTLTNSPGVTVTTGVGGPQTGTGALGRPAGAVGTSSGTVTPTSGAASGDRILPMTPPMLPPPLGMGLDGEGGTGFGDVTLGGDTASLTTADVVDPGVNLGLDPVGLTPSNLGDSAVTTVVTVSTPSTLPATSAVSDGLGRASAQADTRTGSTITRNDPQGARTRAWSVDLAALQGAINRIAAERQTIAENLAALKTSFATLQGYWDGPAGSTLDPLVTTFNGAADHFLAVLDDGLARMRTAYRNYLDTEMTNTGNYR